MHTQQQVAILHIDALPSSLRPAVETHLARTLQSEAMPAPLGTDPLAATWCTRWERAGHRLVRCRQVLNGLRSELEALEACLAATLPPTATFKIERLSCLEPCPVY
ncbi:hypothetical protein [Corynebacterium pelargi]|uniref:Uncharacterized protein n=1 Tax=Corynebacterium pelargi TaxID=1471400 RepID=A0A410W7K2_9CORY|nr:hypothetical protein [Corynebacterium pelargi]QAU51930.1 hypothetical protein CPELA_03245 [Corynebacterium pelargi]GGG71393.1 hypothetical protein GCM10007338_05490 [Corynebacterium pelargi]